MVSYVDKSSLQAVMKNPAGKDEIMYYIYL